MKLGPSDNDSDVLTIEATSARDPVRVARKTVVRLIVTSKQEERASSALQQPSPPASAPLLDDSSDSLSVQITRRREERESLVRRRLRICVEESIDLGTTRIVIHPTTYRGICAPRPPTTLLIPSKYAVKNCVPPFHSDCDVSSVSLIEPVLSIV